MKYLKLIALLIGPIFTKKIINKTKQIIKDPALIKKFIVGTVRYFLYQNDREKLPEHICEQVVYRSQKALECVCNNACLNCGCEMPDLLFCDEACTKEKECFVEDCTPCYGKMKDKNSWQNFKRVKDISITKEDFDRFDLLIKKLKENEQSNN